MGDTKALDVLLAGHAQVEAVIRMSRDGLPLASRTRADAPVDEIVSIAAHLFSAARDVRLLGDDAGRLFVDAGHGSLYCRAIDADTLLLLLTNKKCTEQQLERMFEYWNGYCER
jgi:predicted regulator of Ras-like GTPase activity (Roadblock/LC7/MglB family)